MTSSINFTAINAQYPVAGQDNDSQGFRDNFGSIKSALQTAKSEITDLQDNTAKVNAVNDFQGNQASNLVLLNEAYHFIETNITDTELTNKAHVQTGGKYQIFYANTSTTLTVDEWGTNYQEVRIEVVTNTTTSISIDFAPLGIEGSVKTPDWVTLPIVSTEKASYIFDVWSRDSGATQYVNYIGMFN